MGWNRRAPARPHFAPARRAAVATARALCVASALFAWPATASEPVLTMTIAGKTVTHTPGELLGQPTVATITIPKDIAYQRPMTYRAIPMSAVLAGIAPSASVRFADSSGFAATIPASLLLASAEDGARAYLAI